MEIERDYFLEKRTLCGDRYSHKVLLHDRVAFRGNAYEIFYIQKTQTGYKADGDYIIACPNWGWCCDATDPQDTFWNAERLVNYCSLDEHLAQAIADHLSSRFDVICERMV